VLLSGEGGDEAFAGYPEYRNLPALEAMKAGAGRAKGLLSAGFEALQHLGWKRGGHYQALINRNVVDYYLSRTATPETAFNSLKAQLYRAQLLAHGADALSDAPTRRFMEATGELPLLNRLLYVDTKSWLPDDLLVKADKMTMAASVELRVPLLDHHILEFAASLPTHQKARRWALKRVLKKALEPSIPKEILQRRKAGFPVPYANWMRHELRDYVHDNLLASASFTSQYFHEKPIEMLLKGFARGEAHSARIFSLIVLNLWYEHFYQSPTVADTEASTFPDPRGVPADSPHEATA
jgi:asparagine synthase (glutamine-hydrolysing)